MDVRFDCLFEGMKLPEVSVETMMKGVVVERLPIPERTALQKLPFWDKVGVLILFIFGGFGMWWVQWRLFDWLTKRRRTFQRAKLPNALSDPANSTID